MYLGEKPFANQHQGYIFRILMLVLDNFILSLVFRFQDNYLPRDRKGYGSFHSMSDPTAIVLIWIFTQIQKKADMTSWMIRLDLSDSPSSPVRAKVECCESRDFYRCQVTDCSATRILPSSITGCHPQPTGSIIGLGVVTPLQRWSLCILQAQPNGWCILGNVTYQMQIHFDTKL